MKFTIDLVAPPIELRPEGLYCSAGDFYIDPWGSVERAIITHAHSDHARPGSRSYLTTLAGEPLLHARLGAGPAIESLRYGEPVRLGDAQLSLHPAGHIRGSAQVRIEVRGEVWVISGDYKLAPDPTCEPFDPLRCHTFVTEATFALPIFRWPEPAAVVDAIHSWWRGNQEAGKASLLYAFALGKAQRLLSALDDSIGPIYCHGAVQRFNELYGISKGAPALDAPAAGKKRALVLAPPSAHNSPWARRFAPASTALVSGWMRIRGARRRRALDRGFVLSDHAGWPDLLRAIDATGAPAVWVTHGFRAPLARWLQEHGRDALPVDAHYEGEREEASE